MTITGTASPPHVINEVIGRLRGSADLDGVLIRWGLLSTLPTDRERIYVLGTSGYARRHSLGAYPVRQENYLVRGIIEVSLITTDPTDVSNRLWALIDAVDLALLADRDFTHASYTGELQIVTDDITPTSEGWLAQALFRVGMQSLR